MKEFLDLNLRWIFRTVLAATMFAGQLAWAAPQDLTTKGQSQSTLEQTLRVQLPFSQVTKLSDKSMLFETGNNNLLADPGFEAQTLAVWSTSGGLNIYQTSTASEVNSGSKSLVLDEDGFNGIYAQTELYTIQKYLKGANGQISCSTFIDSSATEASYFVLQVLDAAGNILVTTPLKGLNLDPPHTWTKTVANFVFPNTGATTDDKVRLRILKNVDGSTMTYDPRVDDCYLGAALNNSNGSVYIPWTKYTPTITFQSGGWTNVTIIRSEWMRDGENISIRGAATFSGASAAFSVPQITYPTGVTLQPAGVAESRVSIYTGSNLFFGVATIDTNYFSLFTHSATAGLPYASLTNTSPGTFSSGGYITWAINDVKVSQWIGSGQNVMSLNTLPNQTNWASYTPTFQNLGTPTSVDMQWRKNGPDLEVRGRFTNGTIATGTASFSPPSGLVGNLSSDMVAGVYGHQGSATGAAIVYSSANNHFRFGMSNWQVSATGTQMSTGAFTTVKASIPIVGWSASVVDMPLVRNSVVSTHTDVTKTEWLKVGSSCTSGTCTITRQSGGFTSVTWNSTGTYTVAWPSTTWSAAPSCWVMPGANSASSGTYASYLTSPSTTGMQFILVNTGTGLVNNLFDIKCEGPR